MESHPVAFVPTCPPAHKALQDIRYARRRSKHAQALSAMHRLVVQHLGPFHLPSDLALLNTYLSLLLRLFPRFHRRKKALSTTTLPSQSGEPMAQQEDFLELVFMVFNFKYFFLKTYLTKLRTSQQNQDAHSRESRDWEHLESELYYPRSPFLDTLFLGLIRHKNFNEQLISQKQYASMDLQEFSALLKSRHQYIMANKYYKQYILDSQQVQLRVPPSHLKIELNKFVQQFLELLIQYGQTSRKGRDYRVAYQYFRRAYTCSQEFEKQMNSALLPVFIKVRLVYAVFHLELRNYSAARIVLIQTLQLQQYELQLFDYDNNKQVGKEKEWDKKIKRVAVTLINLMLCYRHLLIFTQVQEAAKLMNLLKPAFKINDEFTYMLERQLYHSPAFKNLDEILLAIAEIKESASEALCRDGFLLTLHQKTLISKEKKRKQELLQFSIHNQFKQSVLRDVSNKVVLKGIQESIAEQSERSKSNVQNLKAFLKYQPMVSQALLPTEQQSTQASRAKTQWTRVRHQSEHQVNKLIKSELSAESKEQGQVMHRTDTMNLNTESQMRQGDSLEMEASINGRSSLLQIKDMNGNVRCSLQKSVHQLNRKDMQLDIQEGFRPQLVQEMELFEDYQEEETSPQQQRRKNYNDIHLSKRQVEIMLRQKGEQIPSKDIDFYMKDKISQQEKNIIYQSLEQFENKCSALKNLQSQQGKVFNFYKKILRFKSREALKNSRKTVYEVPGKPHKVVIDKKQIKQFNDFRLNHQLAQSRNSKINRMAMPTEDESQKKKRMAMAQRITDSLKKIRQESHKDMKRRQGENMKTMDEVKREQQDKAMAINHQNLDAIEKQLRNAKSTPRKERPQFRLYENYNELACLSRP